MPIRETAPFVALISAVYKPVRDGNTTTQTWGTDATGHIRQYLDIVEAIRARRAPAITGEDGRDAVEIVVAAVEASETGRTVTLRTPAE